jgi:hypothetical protein
MKTELINILSSLERKAIQAIASKNAYASYSLQGDGILCEKNEPWPQKGQKDLFPLLSIYTNELPFIPDFLADYEYYTIFFETNNELNIDKQSLIVKKYKNFNNLVPLINNTSYGTVYFEFEVIPDYPDLVTLEHIIIEHYPELLIDFQQNVSEITARFPCHEGIKLGGYPVMATNIASLQENDPTLQIHVDTTNINTFSNLDINVMHDNMHSTVYNIC